LASSYEVLNSVEKLDDSTVRILTAADFQRVSKPVSTSESINSIIPTLQESVIFNFSISDMYGRVMDVRNASRS